MTETISGSKPTGSKLAAVGTILSILLILCLSIPLISSGLEDEPHFADESAMIAQSYYFRLLSGLEWNHVNWLHPAASDHPPLPKFFFGLSLQLAGLEVPRDLDWWIRWQRGDFSAPEDPAMLKAARVPSAVFGIAGCVFVFFVGTLTRGRMIGILAAILLMLNPLYVTHARRAMSDSFTECFVVLTVALSIWGWKAFWRQDAGWKHWLSFAILSSLSGGFAALAKLNGGVAVVIHVLIFWVFWVSAWFIRPKIETPIKTTSLLMGPAILIATCVGSYLIFLGLNPHLTARPQLPPGASAELMALRDQGPLERSRQLVLERARRSTEAMNTPAFSKDRLTTLKDRAIMTIWEGFGRYSPLGPGDIRTKEPRSAFENFHDYGRRSSLLWFPLCLLGILAAFRQGWIQLRAGEPPTAWGLFLYAVISIAMVVYLIPLNWDRYYLPIQAASAVVVPFGVAYLLRAIGSKLILKPPATS